MNLLAVVRDLHRDRPVGRAGGRGDVQRGLRRLAGRERRPAAGRHDRLGQRRPSTRRSTSAAPSDVLRALPARRSSSASSTPDGSDRGVHGHAAGPDRSRTQGALGIGKLQGKQVGTVRYEVVEAVRIGVNRTVDAFGMILDGLGQLGRLDRHEPDRRAAGRRPDRHRRPDRRRVLGSRSDLRPLRGRPPVGQPGARQHPAVPAARRRPDADDRLKAILGFGSASRSGPSS